MLIPVVSYGPRAILMFGPSVSLLVRLVIPPICSFSSGRKTEPKLLLGGKIPKLTGVEIVARL